MDGNSLIDHLTLIQTQAMMGYKVSKGNRDMTVWAKGTKFQLLQGISVELKGSTSSDSLTTKVIMYRNGKVMNKNGNIMTKDIRDLTPMTP